MHQMSELVLIIKIQTHHHVATRLGIEMGIFDTMAGLTESSTVGQLASTVNADHHLVCEEPELSLMKKDVTDVSCSENHEGLGWHGILH